MRRTVAVPRGPRDSPVTNHFPRLPLSCHHQHRQRRRWLARSFKHTVVFSLYTCVVSHQIPFSDFIINTTHDVAQTRLLVNRVGTPYPTLTFIGAVILYCPLNRQLTGSLPVMLPFEPCHTVGIYQGWGLASGGWNQYWMRGFPRVTWLLRGGISSSWCVPQLGAPVKRPVNHMSLAV